MLYRSALLMLICMLSTPAMSQQPSPSQSANANELLAQYDGDDPVGKQFATMRALFYEQGIQAAQAFLSPEGKREVINCQPGKLALTGEQVIDILRSTVKQNPALGATYAPLSIVYALRATFPFQK
jgi:hypothetical protein